MRGEKSPFEMKKECLLPIFEAPPRFGSEGKAPHPGPLPQSGEAKGKAAAKPQRSWRLGWSLIFWGKKKKARALAQGELSLERVQVLRNDLRDSDLELALKKRPQARKASAAAPLQGMAEKPPPWFRKVARLFELERR